MILHDGETVFVAFATYTRWDAPQAWVTECVVIDAANKVIRERGTFGAADRVRVLESTSAETVHATEAEAWQRAAATFAGGADKLTAKADECSTRAAKLAIVTEGAA